MISRKIIIVIIIILIIVPKHIISYHVYVVCDVCILGKAKARPAACGRAKRAPHADGSFMGSPLWAIHYGTFQEPQKWKKPSGAQVQRQKWEKEVQKEKLMGSLMKFLSKPTAIEVKEKIYTYVVVLQKKRFLIKSRIGV